MLIDEVELVLKGGHGGPGRVSFYPGFKSGPDGGNGGRGGNVYAQTTSDLTALNKFSHKKHWEAEAGQPGGSNCRSGRDGEDLILTFPLGTILTDQATREEIELVNLKEMVLLCRGGLGGKGNFELRSSRNTTPKIAQKGLAGKERCFQTVLKLLASFGLIGLPNSGKSSLLNELTATNVKTAEYPFTTLEPNLGVLDKKIIADIPGLIEGASEGKGLGIKFLKHIEKVELLLHCLDSSSEDVMKNYQIVKDEMEKFNSELNKKKEVVIFTKIDLIPPKKLKEQIKIFKKMKKRALGVSIYDWDSLQELKKVLYI